jgi:hypothetical protein
VALLGAQATPRKAMTETAMRSFWVAVALVGLPTAALAQTTSNTQSGVAGTLVDDAPTTAVDTTTTAPPLVSEPSEPPVTEPSASPVSELSTPPAAAPAPPVHASHHRASPATTAHAAPAPTPPPDEPIATTGAATSNVASGITVSESGATVPSHPAHPAPHAPATGSAQAGAAAPGAAQHASAPARTVIQAANPLERAFLNAARQESERVPFRRIFLDSQVALATVSAAPNAAPRSVRLGPAAEACLIFTSDARATQVMGPTAPRQMMTGREALQRVHGAHLVIININLDPFLTLDAESVSAFLSADAAPATPSAGPSQ